MCNTNFRVHRRPWSSVNPRGTSRKEDHLSISNRMQVGVNAVFSEYTNRPSVLNRLTDTVRLNRLGRSQRIVISRSVGLGNSTSSSSAFTAFRYTLFPAVKVFTCGSIVISLTRNPVRIHRTHQSFVVVCVQRYPELFLKTPVRWGCERIGHHRRFRIETTVPGPCFVPGSPNRRCNAGSRYLRTIH